VSADKGNRHGGVSAQPNYLSPEIIRLCGIALDDNAVIIKGKEKAEMFNTLSAFTFV